MISGFDEPWSWVHKADDYAELVDCNGNMIACASPQENHYQLLSHAVACVNAIHAAGIQPGDVAAMVEAVRAWAKADDASRNPFCAECYVKPEWLVANAALYDAAALLPERKESK